MESIHGEVAERHRVSSEQSVAREERIVHSPEDWIADPDILGLLRLSLPLTEIAEENVPCAEPVHVR